MSQLNTIQKRGLLNQVFSEDELGPGGAHHKYSIQHEEFPVGKPVEKHLLSVIQFQKGPRHTENSINGVLDTDLLEISRDRLKSFQTGPFKSDYNQKALEHIELALMYLNRRVEDRIERNVLGTNNK